MKRTRPSRVTARQTVALLVVSLCAIVLVGFVGYSFTSISGVLAESGLAKAVRRGDVRAVRAALNRGANPNTLADERGDEVIREGAVTSSDEGHLANENDQHDTVLYWICGRPEVNTAMVDALLHAGADVNAHGYRGETPLIECILSHSDLAVDLLLAHGARVAECGQDGMSPLVAAAITNDVNATRALLARGANPNLKDAANLLPLGVAYRLGHSEQVQVLLAAGANRRLRDIDGPVIPDDALAPNGKPAPSRDGKSGRTR